MKKARGDGKADPKRSEYAATIANTLFSSLTNEETESEIEKLLVKSEKENSDGSTMSYEGTTIDLTTICGAWNSEMDSVLIFPSDITPDEYLSIAGLKAK